VHQKNSYLSSNKSGWTGVRKRMPGDLLLVEIPLVGCTDAVVDGDVVLVRRAFVLSFRAVRKKR